MGENGRVGTWGREDVSDSFGAGTSAGTEGEVRGMRKFLDKNSTVEYITRALLMPLESVCMDLREKDFLKLSSRKRFAVVKWMSRKYRVPLEQCWIRVKEVVELRREELCADIAP